MDTTSYQQRRSEIESYFDRTAFDAWAKLTSDAPVSRIRATVRAGRDEMRATLLSWLPEDMRGLRLLDAGCGTGALAIEAARRGADVVGVDVSPSLIRIAIERLPEDLGPGSVTLLAGDMLDEAHGEFDHVVAMDSLIHYEAADIAGSLGRLAQRTSGSIVFTFAPGNPALLLMRRLGRLLPRGDRAPSIVPVAEDRLRQLIDEHEHLQGFDAVRSQRVSSGFYKSQAFELACGGAGVSP